MEDIHPKWAFLIYGIWGAVLGIVCIFLSAEAEIELNEGEEEYESHFSSAYVEGQLPRQAEALRNQYYSEKPSKGEGGFCYNLKRNMKTLWKAL
jgi:hypothetical protein